MKTLDEIKQAARKSDYTRIAELCVCSPSLVRGVVNDVRADHHNIQKTFSDMLEARERLEIREAKRRARKEKRESHSA